MKKRATVNVALQKAAIHRVKPEIPKELAQNFNQWTHCEIRSYHQRYMYKKSNGKSKRTRRVTGFIFIFLTNQSGDTHHKALRVIHKSNMTRRDFTSYAQGLTQNIGQSLFHALVSKSTH
ncbi:MAG: hypothetical protein ACKUBY_02815 [Candidatus Moraniibacteriota bacterium]|jgi:hypothetical protein